MIETILLGLVANEIGAANNNEGDINRFKEICNGSPLIPIEEVAVTALLSSLADGDGAGMDNIAKFIGIGQ